MRCGCVSTIALLIGLALGPLPDRCLGDEPVRFNRDIRPLLVDRCFKCHGPDEKQRQGELRLDVREAAVQSAIVPEHPAKSELIARIASDDPDLRMPPADSHKQRLTAAQVELFRRWIDQGAPYEKHWAFIPPVRPEPPKVQNAGWVRSPIDRFILARLEREGLSPSPEADRSTLIRRVTLDLTGLPPTVEDMRAFLQDDSPQAYEKVVDRLLESDRYGEHLARDWLDAARYADTNGYQYDLEREQWVWRDWVIHAFNTNMPFDQFTIEQMAGDLLPDATDGQKLATGFHRNHPITIEGGVIDEEYRVEYVVDRVVTTSTVWMGMTFLCSRCHDHKYDPITQQEFYEFFAFFNQVPERGNKGFDPKLKVASPLSSSQLDELDGQIAAAEQQFQRLLGKEENPLPAWEQKLASEVESQWNVVRPEKMVSAGGAEMKLQEDDSILATGTNPAADTYEITIRLNGPVHAIRLEALKHPSHVNGSTGRGSNGNFVLSEFQVEVAPPDRPDEFQAAKIETAEADYSQKNYHISLAVDGKVDRTGWAVDGNTKFEDRMAVFTLAAPVGERGARLRIRMLNKFGGMHQIGRMRFAVPSLDRRPVPLDVAAIVAKPGHERSDAEREQLQTHLLERFGPPELQQASRAVTQLRQQRDALTANVPATMVLQEMPKPRTTHVLERGEYDKPRDAVSPGTPSALPPMPDHMPRNRLGLAKWLVAPNHPLTARVTVNRFWQRLFGTGLVKTTEDFGAQGEWPSHPDLLDWLAVEFVESGWDVKALHKRIVTSAASRQSARVTPELIERDPQNRLLARGPRMRLEAEAIRDSALAVSGLLVGRIGGPSVFPYHPAGLWQELNNRPGYSRTYTQQHGDNLYRRSMYTFWKRTVPPPSMAAFDAPEREFCVVRRSRTNTPLQAFVLLHDPQFVEAARFLGRRMMTEGGETVEKRLAFGFMLCTSRRPNASELQVLVETFEERLQQYQADRAAAEKVLSVGEAPPDEALDLAEHAAYATVARMLLNLNEFITKE